MATVFNQDLQDLRAMEAAIDLVLAKMKLLATESKKVVGSLKFDQTGDISKLNTELEKVEQTEKDLIEIEKQKARLSKERSNAEKAQIQTIKTKNQLNVQLRKEQERQLKNAKKLKAATEGVTGAYARERKELIRLEKEFKDLIIAEGRATKKTEELRRSVLKVRGNIDRANGSIKRFNDNVGNYRSSLAGSLGTVGQFATGAGAIAAGVMIAGRAIGSAINIIKEFEQANANLQAVLGKTREEMQPLIDQAKALGASTAFSATEVIGLSTEFAKLGFPIQDIQKMTASTLDASAAMGSDLAAQAALTGSTLKAFGLQASDTQRVNDVLAKSTSASALDFAKLNSSMSTIAPVAKKFGFSLEGSVSLLGQLSNAGFDASSAATATRNIMLNLADSSSKLSKRLKEPVKDLPSLVAGLKQLKGEGVDLGEALELTDKRSVAAFATFLDGTDSVLELNNALKGAKGTAAEMAAIQLDTLDGAMKILNSSWEGLILSFEDGSGVMNEIATGVIQDLSIGLSVLSGNFDAASDKLSIFAIWITAIKNGFTLMINVIKLLTTPWRVLFNLVKKLGVHFGILSEKSIDFEAILLKIQKVFLRFPDIIDIVFKGVIGLFENLIFVVFDFARVIKEALDLPKILKEIIDGKESSVKKAVARFGNTVLTAFASTVGKIGPEIAALFASEENEDALAASEKLGEDAGNAFSKGLSKSAGKVKLLKDSDLKKFVGKQEITFDIGANLDPFESDIFDFVTEANKLIETSNKAANERIKKLFQERVQFIQDAIDKGAAAQRKAHEERLAQIDEELAANKQLQKELRADAKAGITDAENNLVFARQKEREAQLARDAEIKRQKRIEEGLAFVKLVISNAGNPEVKNPIVRSIAQFAAMKAAIAALTGFYTGTDSVGSTGSEVKHSSGRDGYLAKLNKGEMVLNNEETDRLKSKGITSRKGLFDLIENNERQKHSQMANVGREHHDLHVTNSYGSNDQVVSKMNELISSNKQAIKSIKSTNWSYDTVTGIVKEVIKEQGKTTENNYKPGGIHG